MFAPVVPNVGVFKSRRPTQQLTRGRPRDARPHMVQREPLAKEAVDEFFYYRTLRNANSSNLRSTTIATENAMQIDAIACLAERGGAYMPGLCLFCRLCRNDILTEQILIAKLVLRQDYTAMREGERAEL